MLTIGQACEVKWRQATDQALDSRLASLPYADEIQALWKGMDTIPVSQRKAWLESDAYEDYSADIEAFLHARAGTPFDEELAKYEGKAPRVVTVSKKPPKGTRRRIIGEVAAQYGLAESVVDNLWQAYRRLERELRESDKT